MEGCDAPGEDQASVQCLGAVWRQKMSKGRSGAAKTSLSAPAVIGGHEMETAEAHGEAAHGEGHHETVEEEEEEKEEEPDAVTWTTALLLIGFLIIFVGILYLVNCTDEDIRAAIWGMINTTVSIFCAATFDNAVFRQIADTPKTGARNFISSWT
eukprot:s4779_g1.t1